MVARPIVHWEIQGRDAEKLRAFYGTMFEWEMTPGPIPSIVNIGAGEVRRSGVSVCQMMSGKTRAMSE